MKVLHRATFHGKEFTVNCSRVRYAFFVGCVYEGEPRKVGWHRTRKIAEKDMEKVSKWFTEATDFGIVPVAVGSP